MSPADGPAGRWAGGRGRAQPTRWPWDHFTRVEKPPTFTTRQRYGREGPASAREDTFTRHGSFQLVCSNPGTQLEHRQQSPGPPGLARDEHLVSASSIQDQLLSPLPAYHAQGDNGDSSAWPALRS